MSWTLYVSTYLEILLNKIRTAYNCKYDLQSMLAPMMWCFDTYPVLSIMVLLIIFAYAVPICLFLIFAIVTFVITFAGFLFLEGAIVAVAFVLLLSVLSTLTIVLGLFLFTCWTLYIIIAQLCQTIPLGSYSDMPISENIFNNNNNHINRSLQVNDE